MSSGKYQIYEFSNLKDSVDISEDELKSVISSFTQYRDSKKVSGIGDIANRRIENKEGNLYNNNSNVGIIQIPSTEITIEFRPKLDKDNAEDDFWTFLPRMLHCLCDFDDFNSRMFMDPEVLVDLPKGSNMVPLFALSLATLCEKAIETGLLKKYLPKNERLKQLKGKIDFASLSKNKAWDLSTIPCRYYDLTFDNHENQIILWCLSRLLQRTKQILNSHGQNENRIVRILREQYVVLSQEITLVPKTRASVLEINYSSLPRHYQDLMRVCQGILTESLFSMEQNGQTARGINFLIDMDWVFEQYMTHLFKEVAKESDFTNKIQIRDQERQSLCDRNRIRIRPDLLVYDTEKKPLAVVDFKWKKNPFYGDNSNFYQIICYGLAQLQKDDGITELDTTLFYASGNDEEFDTISDIFNQEKVLHINKMGLGNNLMSGEPEDIEKKIKVKIREYLNHLL